jgi:hypothetical protein
VGASLINTAKAGTSYAAPKVSHAGAYARPRSNSSGTKPRWLQREGACWQTWSSLFPLPELKELKV